MIKQVKNFVLAGLCLALCAAACLSGCNPKPAAEATAEPFPALSAAPASTPAPSPAPSPATGEEPALGAAAKTAYRAALINLLENHALPDGTDLGHDEFGDPGGNQFALYDVDGDGRIELVLFYNTTYMAGQTAGVYDYDEAAGRLHTELTEYPLLTFYDNGAVQAGWSHNQGLAGGFWPYTLYRYDAATDAYAAVGMVDAWDKAFAPTDFSGNPYPEDVDVSKTGFVYYLIDGAEYREVAPVDASAYEAWSDGYLSGASELAIPFTALTVENIETALGA